MGSTVAQRLGYFARGFFVYHEYLITLDIYLDFTSRLKVISIIFFFLKKGF